MSNTTYPFRLVAVDLDGDRTLIDEYQNRDEAWADLKGHVADLNTAAGGTCPVPELTDWYGPHAGRRLVITGPSHIVLPRTVKASDVAPGMRVRHVGALAGSPWAEFRTVRSAYLTSPYREIRIGMSDGAWDTWSADAEFEAGA